MNIPFRRFLKHVLKNAQRLPYAQRDSFVQTQITPHGLWADNFAEFSMALTDLHRTRGRMFRRIGNAAKKNKQVVDILSVAYAIENKRDVRRVPFFMPVFLKTPQEVILWKVWPGKPVERKIGV